MTVRTRPIAVSDDHPLAWPREYLGPSGARRRSIEERQPPLKRCEGLVGDDPVDTGKGTLPPAPVFAEEAVAESLNEVRDNHRSRRSMEKDDLVHGKRAPEPDLVDVTSPFGGDAVAQRFAEL